jgi:hypothetical protein
MGQRNPSDSATAAAPSPKQRRTEWKATNDLVDDIKDGDASGVVQYMQAMTDRHDKGWLRKAEADAAG